MIESHKKIMIAAAGTGGHVMPGLAVARVLRARGWDVEWIGTTTGMESGLVAKDGIDFTGLNFRGMRGRGLLGAIKGGFKLIGAFFAARRALKKSGATALFSTGGYVAVPVGYAAKSLGLPIVVMNCDADLLMSTYSLLPLCDALACGFAGGARTHAGNKGVITGNPVRADIVALPEPRERLLSHTGPLRILVFGGSLGAKVFNEVIPEMMALIAPERRPQILHQTGKGNDEAVRAHYARLGVEADVRPFIEDMAGAYRDSDLVICRAGATSVAELCAAGAASILVPFVAKTTSHQMGNAKFMASQGAGIFIAQSDFEAARLAELIEGYHREFLVMVAEHARELSKPEAAQNVAELIETVVARRQGH